MVPPILSFLSEKSVSKALPSISRSLFSLCTNFCRFFSLTFRSFASNQSLISSSSPNDSRFLCLLSRCGKVEDLKPLLSLLVVQGFITHEHLVQEYTRHCFRLRAPELAISTFDAIKSCSVFLQNHTIRCLCDDGLFEDVLSVYKKCQTLGCTSDNYTFPFVLKASLALRALQSGREIHCAVLRTGFVDNLVVQTTLVDFYAKVGKTGGARMLLDRISQPDIVCWNALISGYSLNGLEQEVFEAFREICAMGLKPNVSTLASIFPVCYRLGNFNIGQCLHGFAVKRGYLEDETLTPALISMYSAAGYLSVAVDLFDSLPKKNITIWNSMISAFSHNNKSHDAFKLFQKLIQNCILPSMVSFVSVLPCCESLGSIWYGESLHACVIKYGLENQLSVVTGLLSMYAKFDDVESAEFLFHRMPQKNILSWNSMISGYVHNGLWGKSLAAFQEMQFAGFEPDAISNICVLFSCSKLEAILLGKSVHAYSLKRGIIRSLNVSNALLAFYSDCLQQTTAIKLFERMDVRNTISWNTLISRHAQNREKTDALILLHQMQQEGVQLDLVTLISVLPCHAGIENLGQGMAVHCYAIKAGFSSDSSLANALINMYVNCEELGAGKLIFEDMPHKDEISWNAIMTGLRYHNLNDEVVALFERMIVGNGQPTGVTLLNILPICCTLLLGKSLHAYAVKTGFTVETPVLTSLVSMYARFGITNSCILLFQMGEKDNISLWNAIISAHVQLKKAVAALSFFFELLRMGMEPDYVTALCVISACSQSNNWNLTNSIMAFMIHKGFDKDVAASNALINLYARCGDISLARKLFEAIIHKDGFSWSVMIAGYGLHGDGEAALALLSQMRLFGFKPDDITYLSVLSACSHAGLVEQGRKVFNTMQEDGISPRMEHYACLVDLLGRTGHLNEAYDIAMKSLPMKPSKNLLESLLGACLIHGRVELGERISGLLFEIYPENPRPYVILHNIYAAAGRWTDANRVRSDMGRKQVRKLPGFSLLERSY